MEGERGEPNERRRGFATPKDNRFSTIRQNDYDNWAVNKPACQQRQGNKMIFRFYISPKILFQYLYI
jgi:hypothetical protein